METAKNYVLCKRTLRWNDAEYEQALLFQKKNGDNLPRNLKGGVKLKHYLRCSIYVSRTYSMLRKKSSLTKNMIIPVNGVQKKTEC